MAKSDENKERELQPLRTLHAQHPDIIPAVPQGVNALEFGGWFEEANRRIELWAIRHRSAADMDLRIQLQKQINVLEEEHLRYGKTQSEQLLLQHRHEAEISKLQLQKVEADDQAEQIRERAAQRKNPPAAPAPAKRESKGDKLARLHEEMEREIQRYADNPRVQELLRRDFEDREMKIMEGRD